MSFLHHPLRSACVGAGGRAAGGTALFYPSSISAPRLRQQQVCGPHLASTAGAGPSACSHALAHRRLFRGETHKNTHKLPPHQRGGSEQDAPTRRRDAAPAHLSVRAASHRLRSPSRPCPLRVARGLVSAWNCRPARRSFALSFAYTDHGCHADAGVKRQSSAAMTHRGHTYRLTGEKNNSGQMKKSCAEKNNRPQRRDIFPEVGFSSLLYHSLFTEYLYKLYEMNLTGSYSFYDFVRKWI